MRISRLLFVFVAGILGLAAISQWPGIVRAGELLAMPGLPPESRKTLAGSTYMDVAGKPIRLGQGSSVALTFVFLNVECPISNKLVPELNRLATVAKKQNIEFYGVLSDPTVSRPEAQKHSKEYKIEFPMLFDASGTLAATLEPKVTPHVFMLDKAGKLLYEGRVNDSYVDVGNPRTVTTSNDLEDALSAVGIGKAPKVMVTQPVGCVFESWKHEEKPAKITWSRDIAPLVYANCSGCHHDGEVAPFTLMSYKDASKRAEMLAAVTKTKQMPPWKAADAWGTFHDERRLTPAQIALFQQWAAAGAPEGDKADAPPAPVFSDKWQLGTPDMVVKMAKPMAIPAAGRDIMAYTVVPLDVPADKYVVGFEFRPGNRKVVHHMIAFLDANGNARKLAAEKGDGTTYLSFGGPGFTPTGGLGGWAPGATPRFLPDGVGRPLRKGSDLVMQIHYHPSGKAETDQGEIALYFAKKPIQQISISIPLTNRQIDIAPGDNNYIRTASLTLPLNVTLQGVTPHMHNLGREMKVTATFPDGHKQQLININDWDWNWQDQYQFAKAIKLPRGTTLELWARYDNSKDNPRNPQNPPKRVVFGEQTTNEMCLAFLQVTVDGLVAGNRATDAAALRDRLQQLIRGQLNP